MTRRVRPFLLLLLAIACSGCGSVVPLDQCEVFGAWNGRSYRTVTETYLHRHEPGLAIGEQSFRLTDRHSKFQVATVPAGTALTVGTSKLQKRVMGPWHFYVTVEVPFESSTVLADLEVTTRDALIALSWPSPAADEAAP